MKKYLAAGMIGFILGSLLSQSTTAQPAQTIFAVNESTGAAIAVEATTDGYLRIKAN